MSDIQLRMNPNDSPMSWQDFAQKSPGFSVAIDGYVGEGPNEVVFSPEGPRQNMNHHEGVYRPATLATCQQSLMAVRTGFFDTFRDKTGRKLNIFANDCDEDVCATVFCLRNSHLVEGTINPAVNRFIGVTGVMDVTGGSYPLPPDLPYLEEHTWIVEPYLRFRAHGGLDRFRNPDDFSLVVEEVNTRIMQHILGNGKRVTLDTDYDVLRRGNGWALVKEIGSRARLRMFDEGIHAFVSIAERGDGKLRATVGRFSGYTKFPVQKILEAFNTAEGLGPTDDKAGGSDLIGGTSRKNGTTLTVDQLFELTEASLTTQSVL